MLVQQYREQVRTVVAGRPWIVATGVVVASLRIAKELKGLGATKVLAIGFLEVRAHWRMRINRFSCWIWVWEMFLT